MTLRPAVAALFWPAIALVTVNSAWMLQALRGELVTWYWIPVLHWLAWLPLSLVVAWMTVSRAATLPHLLTYGAVALVRPFLSRVLRAPLDLESGPWDVYFQPSWTGAASDALIYGAIAVTVWLVASRERAAREAASWDRLVDGLRTRAAARLEQNLLPDVIRRGLQSIAASAVSAPQTAERITLRLARLVRMVLRTEGEEWIPWLQQARRLGIIASLWHPDARVTMRVPREQRTLLVPSAVSTVVARLMETAKDVRELHGELRDEGERRVLELTCDGDVSDVRMPDGVDVHRDGPRVLVSWAMSASRVSAQKESPSLPLPSTNVTPQVMLIGMPLLAILSVMVRLRNSDPAVLIGYTLVWLLVAVAAHPTIEGKLLDRRTPAGIVLLAVLAANFALPNLLFRAIGKPPMFNLLDALQYTMVAWVVTGASITAHFLRREEWHRRRATSVSGALTAAEIVALDANIHPHFLFNVLNTVASQLHDDPAAASRTARTVGRLFDRLTRDAGMQETTLHEELSLLEDYIAVERDRHGERVRLHLSIDGNAHSVAIPRLVLLTLVQNAVKHGVARMQRPCDIRVQCRRKRRLLYIEATNDIPSNALREIAIGLGLRQLQRRLGLLYGGQATSAFGIEAERFHARLALPRH